MEGLALNFVVATPGTIHKDDDDASFYDDDSAEEEESGSEEEEVSDEEGDEGSCSCSSEGSIEEEDEEDHRHQGNFMMGQQYFNPGNASFGNTNNNCFSDSFVTDGEGSERNDDPEMPNDSSHSHASLQRQLMQQQQQIMMMMMVMQGANGNQMPGGVLPANFHNNTPNGSAHHEGSAANGLQDDSIHTDVLSFDCMLGKKPGDGSPSASAASLTNSNLMVVNDQASSHNHRATLSRSSSKSSRHGSRHSSRSRSQSRSRSSSRSRHSNKSASRSNSRSRHDKQDLHQPEVPPTLMPMPTDDDAAEDDVEDFFANIQVAKPTKGMPPRQASTGTASSSKNKDKHQHRRKKRHDSKGSLRDEKEKSSGSRRRHKSGDSGSRRKDAAATGERPVRSSSRRSSLGSTDGGSGGPTKQESRRRGIEAAAEVLSGPGRRRSSIPGKDGPMDCSSANHSQQSNHSNPQLQHPRGNLARADSKGRRGSIAQRRASMSDRRSNSRKMSTSADQHHDGDIDDDDDINTEAELAAALEAAEAEANAAAGSGTPTGRRAMRSGGSKHRIGRNNTAGSSGSADRRRESLAILMGQSEGIPNTQKTPRKGGLQRSNTATGASRRRESMRASNNSKRQLLMQTQQRGSVSTLTTAATETSGSSSTSEQQHQQDGSESNITKLAPSRRDRASCKVSTRDRIRRIASERGMEGSGGGGSVDNDDTEHEHNNNNIGNSRASASGSMSRRKSGMMAGSLRRGLGRCKSEPPEALHDIMYVDIDDCTIVADIYDDNDDSDNDDNNNNNTRHGISPSPKSVRQVQAKARKSQQMVATAKAAKNSLLSKSNKSASARNVVK